MFMLRYRGIAGVALLLTCSLAGQARALSNGPNSPGAVFNDVSFGSVAWTTPANAQASDDAYAQAAPGAGSSNYLEATNFGLAIPASAIIDGIEVGIEKSATADSGPNFVADSRVRIVKGGVVGSTDRSNVAHWPLTDTIVIYGGPADLWGDTWTAADVNANGFGVAISATDGVATLALVDHITMTVYYSLCSAAPRVGCRTAGRGLLLVKDNTDDNKDKLIFKLTNAASTSQTEFQDPTATTVYGLCLYQNGAFTHGITVPPSGTLWEPVSTVGFKYKDTTGAAQGVQRVILKGNTDNRAKIIVKGKGLALPDPVPALTLPVVMQLINSDSGLCCEGTFDTPHIKRHQTGIFKGMFSN